MPQENIPPSSGPAAYEGSGLDLPLIRRVAGIILVMLVMVIGATFAFFHLLEGQFTYRTSEAAPRVSIADLPPEPRLQTHPLYDLQQMRVAEDAHLNGYQWLDKQQGFAQIPIDRAMDLWLRNYQATASAKTTVPSVSELQMRQQKAEGATHAP